jgi:UDP-N-acetylglucosamine 2-epimerase (non-hydrolysing)
MSDLFAHSEEAKHNLVSEGIDESKIEVTGNTVIDALLDVAARSLTRRICP